MRVSKRLIITLKIVPAVIWILVCTEEVTKSESFDLTGDAAVIDIDETIDLQIDALAALAALVYLAQKQWKLCDRPGQCPFPHDPAARSARREVGESIADVAGPLPPRQCPIDNVYEKYGA